MIPSPPPEVLEQLARTMGLNIPGPLLQVLVDTLGGGGGDQVSVSSAVLLHRRLDGLDDKAHRRLFSDILENPKYSSLHRLLYEAIYETAAKLSKEG